MKRALRALTFLLLPIGIALSAGDDPAALDAAEQARPGDPAPGSRGVALTTIEGSRVEEIPLTFLGTQQNALGPGYDMHLVMLEGPLAERVGVAAGMSGSPVFVDGELIGALSYRIGFMPREPVAGVTPFRDMLSAAKTPSGPRSGEDEITAPIGTPVQVGGLVGPVREWLAPRLREQSFVPIEGGGGVGAAAGELRPGSPVGVELVRGDLSIAATGTVTWIDGEQVYAFGHSFLGDGRIEMAMTSAEVIHTLADAAGSFKLSRLGPVVGSITDDRLTAVVGRTGRTARMIPLALTVRGADFGERRFRFEIARHAALTPLLSGVVVANTLLSDVGHDARSTMLVNGNVAIDGAPDLALDLAFAADRAPAAGLALAAELQRLLSVLWSNPFSAIDVSGIQLDVEVGSEANLYRVEALHYDRGPKLPGESFELQCVLRKYRGETTTERFQLRVPDDFAGEGRLILAVGPPDQIDRALGRPLDQRLESARDLDGMIRALGQRRSAHRLTAVLFRRAPGVVSRGEGFDALPPTAERLLASRGATGAARRMRVALLARDEIELDGPVDGGLSVNLKVGPGRGSGEEK